MSVYLHDWSEGGRDEYMALVRAKRGPEAADRLLADCREQWARGGRGQHGEWR